eukprot:8680410-Alexandrium_andersonii.AAC.1
MAVYSNGSGIDTALSTTVARDRASRAPTEPLLTHTSIAVLHSLNPRGPTEYLVRPSLAPRASLLRPCCPL